jgi:hypothetical protein
VEGKEGLRGEGGEGKEIEGSGTEGGYGQEEGEGEGRGRHAEVRPPFTNPRYATVHVDSITCSAK